uniref:Uncharacterized protein n=1 Tax=Setaria italica TaxID=4555 RepID=K3Z1T4_SETIT
MKRSKANPGSLHDLQSSSAFMVPSGLRIIFPCYFHAVWLQTGQASGRW